MGKPITEVMAAVYWAEKVRLVQAKGSQLTAWKDLPAPVQAQELAAMAEVTRFFGLFDLELRIEEGKGFLAKIEKPDRSNVVRLPSPQAPPLENKPQFTGRACPECGSLNTVQNGKCLLCMECKATGECG